MSGEIDFEILKQKKEDGKAFPLDKDRKRSGALKEKVLSLLKEKPLTVDEIKEKVGKKQSTVYNACRRYEKAEFIVAFEIGSTVYFVEKKKAEEEGLI